MTKKILKDLIVRILFFEAKLALEKYKPKIIAVTGSVGKTSTKDAIYSALAGSFHVRKSEKSFNSEIGVPLTILGLPNAWNNPLAWLQNIIGGALLIFSNNEYPKWLVLEIGADRPGDIKNIAQWLKPDIVVVTRFAPVPVHVEFFASPEEVVKEKAELVKALKSDGNLILSSDDPDVLSLEKLTRSKVTTFGMADAANVRCVKHKILYKKVGRRNRPAGIVFNFDADGHVYEMAIQGTVGAQAVQAFLAGFTVARSLGLKEEEIAKAFENYGTPPGRMRLIEAIKESTIIDDTYNSSPVAAKNALETLKLIKTSGKKIAVLGDMMELGKFSVDEHRAVGALAATCADFLVTVGVRARDIAEGALDAQMDEMKILQFDDSKEAGKQLESILAPGDVVLIKGSQAVRMEKTVEEIMAHPEDKEKLLVRQEEEWRLR